MVVSALESHVDMSSRKVQSIAETPLLIIPPKHVVVTATDTVSDTVRRHKVTWSRKNQSVFCSLPISSPHTLS